MIQQEGTRLVTLSQAVQEELVHDVYQRADIEACGVLIGSLAHDGWVVEHAQPLRNSAHSAVYFEFAPEELLAAELAYPDQIVGVYHSHPTGYARASGTDKENMRRVNVEQAIPWIWLIVCGPFDTSNTPRQQDLQRLLGQRIIAYYHYQEKGLQRITVHYEIGS
jgi:proteasome lid subunit RPN8/RPN11